MRKYLRVWLHLCSSSFQTFFVSRVGSILFLIGKILRFIFFLGFIILLVSKTQALVGYDLWQILLFYLTFNLVDSTTQMLFREVYRFRQQIVSGSFDLILVKPINVLFRSLFGWTDLLDSINLVPLIFMIIFVATKISNITPISIVIYCLLIFNSLLIAMSFHIIVLALAIVTTEIDHAVMIYRDFTSMGRFPIDIYKEPLRSLVTFAIPIGIMMTIPTKALIGLLDFSVVLISFTIGFGIFILSLFLWKFALRRYTSASS